MLKVLCGSGKRSLLYENEIARLDTLVRVCIRVSLCKPRDIRDLTHGESRGPRTRGPRMVLHLFKRAAVVKGSTRAFIEKAAIRPL